MEPPEEDVACRLHQALPGDNPLPVVRESARPEELLEYGRLRLLHLQEQRILTVAAKQQGNPGLRSDAPDSDDLACEVDQMELVNQNPPVVVERFAVCAQNLPK